MIEIIGKWDEVNQIGFFLVCFVIAAFVSLFLAISLFNTIRVSLRGYPPVKEYIPDCENDNNLTGKCLKPGGCKTINECNQQVDNK